jgi:hypothetical protein
MFKKYTADPQIREKAKGYTDRGLPAAASYFRSFDGLSRKPVEDAPVQVYNPGSCEQGIETPDK